MSFVKVKIWFVLWNFKTRWISHNGSKDISWFNSHWLFWASVGFFVENGFLRNKWSTTISISVNHWDWEVEFAKDSMLLNLLETNSEFRIGNEDLAEEVTHSLSDEFVVLWQTKIDFLVDALSWLCVEWCLPGGHFNNEYTQAPYVYLVTMTIVSSEDLGSNVGWGTTICLSLLAKWLQLFRKAKVDHFEMSSILHGNN